jgi:hypothetical protein
MKDKTGFGQQIGIPIAYPWRSRDIGAPTNPAKPNFHALGLATLAPNGRNINRFILLEGLLNCWIHCRFLPIFTAKTQRILGVLRAFAVKFSFRRFKLFFMCA